MAKGFFPETLSLPCEHNYLPTNFMFVFVLYYFSLRINEVGQKDVQSDAVIIIFHLNLDFQVLLYIVVLI